MGKIKKIVRFTLTRSKTGLPFYNLEFGDWNKNEQEIEHLIVTNNKDKEKVLITIAKIAVLFTDQLFTAKEIILYHLFN